MAEARRYSAAEIVTLSGAAIAPLEEHHQAVALVICALNLVSMIDTCAELNCPLPPELAAIAPILKRVAENGVIALIKEGVNTGSEATH